MQNKKSDSGFTPQEHLVSILPAIIAGVVLLLAIIVSAFVNFHPPDQAHKTWLIVSGAAVALHFGFYYLIHTLAGEKSFYVWANAVVAGVALCTLNYFLPREVGHLIYILVFISSLPASLLCRRGPAYTLIFTVTTFHFIMHAADGLPPHELITHFGFTATAFIGIETVHQLKNIAAQRIQRLEIINDLSKQITSTLDTKKVIDLLDKAFQNAFEADAYYIGTVHGDQLRLELLYDDGEYFDDLWVDRKGTLSNWVVSHQKGLFLPDLRKRVELEDVEIITVGKNKTTHSWMGAPMRGAHVDGFMAISSYRPNAFDRNDMELLYNIAQRAALALDNTHHHEQVEKRAQLDSLTGVYNHGYFIKILRKQTNACREKQQPLSLIMLDIDYFKQYNDTFGHLIGDEVLVSLCNVIRQHIKSDDAVGRWGGEEFAVSLPNTNARQALLVAERIRRTMSALKVRNAEQLTIPIPTVSQGISVFPAETDDITKLIDLADKRLYVAKERGRDQIESASAS